MKNNDKVEQALLASPLERQRRDDAAAAAGGEDETTLRHKEAVGAGVATGLCLFPFFGPVVATALGLGVGYAAQNDDQGPVGKSARKVGDASLAVQHKAQTWESEHHVAERTGTFLTTTWDKMARGVDARLQKWNLSPVCGTTATVNDQ